MNGAGGRRNDIQGESDIRQPARDHADFARAMWFLGFVGEGRPMAQRKLAKLVRRGPKNALP
jgi:hypothetical protein